MGRRKCCCCVCGQLCSGGECADTLALQGTTSGATNGLCGSCSALNAVFALTWVRSWSAATWNASTPTANGRPTPAGDAKAGTKICQWDSADIATACSSPPVSWIGNLIVSTYFGTDDKWHACALFTVNDGFGSFELSGDTEFPSSGVPIDCTAFSISIPLSVASGSPAYCNMPTSILVELAP